MAGIEKICEFSGDYPAHKMYGYKHNQLQIMPEYRKKFRGCEAKLYISFDELRWVSRTGCSHSYHPDQVNNYEPPFESEKEFISYYKKQNKERLIKSFNYVLITKDGSLQGQVYGEYHNYTSDLSAVKRKLKRLLRCRKLDIEFVDDVFKLPE
jgi:hypothetical protein